MTERIGKNRLNPQTGEWKTEWHEVTDYSKLVEALERHQAAWGDEQYKELTDLARQLIEENERLKKNYTVLEAANDTFNKHFADLQARLSAAIEAAELKEQILKDHGVEWWMVEDGVKFVDQARLSAAEATIRERDDEIADLRGGA